MDTGYTTHSPPPRSENGNGLHTDERQPIMLLCIVLIVLALAAPLLVTLPQTLEAAATPSAFAATVRMSGRGDEEALPGRAPAEPLDQRELATWRLRASD